MYRKHVRSVNVYLRSHVQVHAHCALYTSHPKLYLIGLIVYKNDRYRCICHNVKVNTLWTLWHIPLPSWSVDSSALTSQSITAIYVFVTHLLHLICSSFNNWPSVMHWACVLAIHYPGILSEIHHRKYTHVLWQKSHYSQDNHFYKKN